MQWIKKYLLVVLLALGITLLLCSIALYNYSGSAKWILELAKAMMGLSFTVIFGGIIKLIFDKYQDDKKQEEKSKEFKVGILNQLRKVFDNVDGARLLIEAHKSAKTYSEKMQENIIPSIVTLFDIKRSLVDSGKIMEEEELLQLRLNIHYIIAYLQVLANEYKTDYPSISNKQFLHEKLKEKAREIFVEKLVNNHPKDFYSSEVLSSSEVKETIKEPPRWVWDSILGLKYMGLFIEDDYNGPYRKMFVDFYERSKKTLKDQPDAKIPDWYREEHLEKMKEIDKLIKEGELRQGDSLVAILVEYLRIKTENIKETTKNSNANHLHLTDKTKSK